MKSTWTERAMIAIVNERMSRGYALCQAAAWGPRCSTGARSYIDRVTRLTVYLKNRMVRTLWR